jgi:quinol monooxygenase YgiN
MSKPLTIIAISTAKAGHEQTVRAAQQQLVVETLKEQGCLRYELHESLDDPRVRILVESWASEADWQNHMQGEAIKQYRASGARELLQESTLHRMEMI